MSDEEFIELAKARAKESEARLCQAMRKDHEDGIELQRAINAGEIDAPEMVGLQAWIGSCDNSETFFGLDRSRPWTRSYKEPSLLEKLKGWANDLFS